jgi:SAM-dependent methyltransferase
MRALAVGVVTNMLRLLPPGLRLSSIIDIGAGSGNVLRRLHELGIGARYSAVDIQEAMPEAVRRNLPDVEVETLVTDTTRLPYPDRYFDLGILSHVIMHVEDPQPLLREAGRVAQYVYVEVPLWGTTGMRLAARVKGAFGHSLRQEYPGVACFTPLDAATFPALLKDAGLALLASRIYYPAQILAAAEREAARHRRLRGRAHALARRCAVALLGERWLARRYNGFMGALVVRRGEPGLEAAKLMHSWSG